MKVIGCGLLLTGIKAAERLFSNCALIAFNVHRKIHGLFAVTSCAKTAEPIEMQFGMLSEMGPGNMYYTGI